MQLLLGCCNRVVADTQALLYICCCISDDAYLLLCTKGQLAVLLMATIMQTSDPERQQHVPTSLVLWSACMMPSDYKMALTQGFQGHVTVIR